MKLAQQDNLVLPVDRVTAVLQDFQVYKVKLDPSDLLEREDQLVSLVVQEMKAFPDPKDRQDPQVSWDLMDNRAILDHPVMMVYQDYQDRVEKGVLVEIRDL